MKNITTVIKLFSMSLLMVTFYSCSDDISVVSDTNEDLSLALESRQFYFNNFQQISPCEAGNLTYYVDPSCYGTDFYTDPSCISEGDDNNPILLAIEAYNNAGSAVSFTPAASAGDADLVIECPTTASLGLDVDTGLNGIASLPFDAEEFIDDFPFEEPNVVNDYFESGGTMGGLLYLVTETINDCGCEVMLCNLQGLVMHEIGHTLGIAHNGATLPFPEEMSTSNVPGTPSSSYDESSVFNNGNANPPIDEGGACARSCTFNENDLAALNFLYPDMCRILPCFERSEHETTQECWQICYDCSEDVRVGLESRYRNKLAACTDQACLDAAREWYEEKHEIYVTSRNACLDNCSNQY